MNICSWLKADSITKIANVTDGVSFRFQIPQQFGGGHIRDEYRGGGLFGLRRDGEARYDIFEILAFWNKEIAEAQGFTLKSNVLITKVKERDRFTDENRVFGIAIADTDEKLALLQFPPKLTSASYKGSYEDLIEYSKFDPNKGLKDLLRT